MPYDDVRLSCESKKIKINADEINFMLIEYSLKADDVDDDQSCVHFTHSLSSVALN